MHWNPKIKKLVGMKFTVSDHTGAIPAGTWRVVGESKNRALCPEPVIIEHADGRRHVSSYDHVVALIHLSQGDQ